MQPTYGGGVWDAIIGDFDISPMEVDGINNASIQPGSITIYPNPANESITVGMNILKQSDAEINIYDMLGQLVYSDNLKSQIGEISRKINVTSLATGPYLVRVTEGDNNYTQKFVKEN